MGGRTGVYFTVVKIVCDINRVVYDLESFPSIFWRVNLRFLLYKCCFNASLASLKAGHSRYQ